MSVLNSGRIEPCKNSAGGLKELWLTTFVPYQAKLIIGYREMMITNFPTTLVFKYEGEQKTFDESKNDDGFYQQEIFIRYTKQQLIEAQDLTLLLKKKVRVIVVDRNEKIRVAGLHNGLDVEVKADSGGSRGGFNGYDIKLTGLEELSAPFLNSLPGSGFEKEGVTFNCLLASSDRPSSLGDLISSCNIVQ